MDFNTGGAIAVRVLGAQLATRCPRPFAFQGFSEKAVERKLQSMEKVLPESLFKLPLHIPEAELGEVLADCRLRACKRARTRADQRRPARRRDVGAVHTLANGRR